MLVAALLFALCLSVGCEKQSEPAGPTNSAEEAPGTATGSAAKKQKEPREAAEASPTPDKPSPSVADSGAESAGDDQRDGADAGGEEAEARAEEPQIEPAPLAGRRGVPVSDKVARGAIGMLAEKVDTFRSRGPGKTEWGALLGSQPAVLYAGHSEGIAVHTEVQSFEEAMWKDADGLCMPALVDCHDGCCAFLTEMTDPCYHHGTSLVQACFVESEAGPRLDELWIICPFEYQASVENPADECLELRVDTNGIQSICSPPVEYSLYARNRCEAELSSTMDGYEMADGVMAYDLGSCDRLECHFEPPLSLGGQPVDVEVRISLESKVPKLHSFEAHARARGYRR